MVDPSTSLVLTLSCQKQESELGSLFPLKRDCTGTYCISVDLNLSAGRKVLSSLLYSSHVFACVFENIRVCNKTD